MVNVIREFMGTGIQRYKNSWILEYRNAWVLGYSKRGLEYEYDNRKERIWFIASKSKFLIFQTMNYSRTNHQI